MACAARFNSTHTIDPCPQEYVLFAPRSWLSSGSFLFAVFEAFGRSFCHHLKPTTTAQDLDTVRSDQPRVRAMLECAFIVSRQMIAGRLGVGAVPAKFEAARGIVRAHFRRVRRAVNAPPISRTPGTFLWRHIQDDLPHLII